MLLKPPCSGLGKYTWTLKVLYCSGSSELSEKDTFPLRRFTELEAIKLTNPSEIFNETVVAKRGSIVILNNASFKRLRSVFRPLGLTALDLYGFDRSQRCRQRSDDALFSKTFSSTCRRVSLAKSHSREFSRFKSCTSRGSGDQTQAESNSWTEPALTM